MTGPLDFSNDHTESLLPIGTATFREGINPFSLARRVIQCEKRIRQRASCCAASLMVGLGACLASIDADAQPWGSIPTGYPKDYGQTIDAARKEGKLVIYGATDLKAAEPLIKDFTTLYSGIKVEYNDMSTTEVYNRFVVETAKGETSPDVLWSSAMDLQIKLVSDGLALAYRSPETSAMPKWSIWKDMAYGTTYEPVVFVYNKRNVPAGDVPTTHAEFARLLASQSHKYRNKVATYDIGKSALGFMFFTLDMREDPSLWKLLQEFGDVGVKVHLSTATMMERISSGENLLGYNILGSYAMVRARKDPSLGVSVPKDYALVLSRVMFIAKSARNLNAAKLWLDYILSKRGQSIIANESQLFSIRDDVAGETTFATLTKQYGAALRPIPVSPLLLQYQDMSRRQKLLLKWKEAITTRP